MTQHSPETGLGCPRAAAARSSRRTHREFGASRIGGLHEDRETCADRAGAGSCPAVLRGTGLCAGHDGHRLGNGQGQYRRRTAWRNGDVDQRNARHAHGAGHHHQHRRFRGAEHHVRYLHHRSDDAELQDADPKRCPGQQRRSRDGRVARARGGRSQRNGLRHRGCTGDSIAERRSIVYRDHRGGRESPDSVAQLRLTGGARARRQPRSGPRRPGANRRRWPEQLHHGRRVGRRHRLQLCRFLTESGCDCRSEGPDAGVSGRVQAGPADCRSRW